MSLYHAMCCMNLSVLDHQQYNAEFVVGSHGPPPQHLDLCDYV